MKLLWLILSWCMLGGQLTVIAPADLPTKKDNQDKKEISIGSLNEDLNMPSSQTKSNDVKPGPDWFFIDLPFVKDFSLRKDERSTPLFESLTATITSILNHFIAARAP
jgi:hypothetical protein